MENPGRKIKSSVTHTKSFLAGLLLGGLAAAVVILLLGPPRIENVWQLPRSPVISPPT